jgi:hypothetical protein
MTRPRNVPKVESRANHLFLNRSIRRIFERGRSSPRRGEERYQSEGGLDGKLHALLIYDYPTE